MAEQREIGDRVLVEVADALRRSIRGHDTVARMGGEEFAILLPDTDAATASELSERARASVAAVPVAGIELSTSAGVATDTATVTPADLVERADKALYRAKHRGRNRTVSALAESAVLLDATQS